MVKNLIKHAKQLYFSAITAILVLSYGAINPAVEVFITPTASQPTYKIHMNVPVVFGVHRGGFI